MVIKLQSDGKATRQDMHLCRAAGSHQSGGWDRDFKGTQLSFGDSSTPPPQ